MGYYVQIDKMLDGLVKEMEKLERLEKTHPSDSSVGYLELIGGFKSSFDEDEVGFFLNQFKSFSKDYSSNQRRLIRNFIFSFTGEGYFQETVNGKKWTKENCINGKFPKSPKLKRTFDSVVKF